MSLHHDETYGQMSNTPHQREQQIKDFDAMYEFVLSSYCYFAEKATDWEKVGRLYHPRACTARNIEKFTSVLEEVLDQLYDPHTHIVSSPAIFWHPSVSDIYAEWRDDKVVVLEIRPNSQAASAGIEPGEEILFINGVSPLEKVNEQRLCCLRYPDPSADAWTLLSVLSRRPNYARTLVIRNNKDVERTIRLNDFPIPPKPTGPLVRVQLLPDGFGYVRIASFTSPEVISEFDHALDALRNTKGLIIDVRNNPGGDTAIARPIMGRLIQEKKQYAWMARRDGVGLGNRWPEYVEPRGPWTYAQPCVILVNHWSASMAEGFAMGLDGMKRGIVIGTRMAGLGAAVSHKQLSYSKINLQISTEPVYHIDGTPRFMFTPAVEVNTIISSSLDSNHLDPFLEAGVRVLRNERF